MMIGQTDNEQKPRLDLLPPEAVLEVGRVLGYDADQFASNNWREVPNGTQVYLRSALLHIIKYMGGERVEPKSNLPRLACATTALMYCVALNESPDVFRKFEKPETRR